jgi:hypothetical protein
VVQLASYTENINLAKPSSTDFTNESREMYNDNSDTIDAVIQTIIDSLGGLSFKAMTQAEYDAISNPDPSTLYVIREVTSS